MGNGNSVDRSTKRSHKASGASATAFASSTSTDKRVRDHSTTSRHTAPVLPTNRSRQPESPKHFAKSAPVSHVSQPVTNQAPLSPRTPRQFSWIDDADAPFLATPHGGLAIAPPPLVPRLPRAQRTTSGDGRGTTKGNPLSEGATPPANEIRSPRDRRTNGTHTRTDSAKDAQDDKVSGGRALLPEPHLSSSDHKVQLSLDGVRLERLRLRILPSWKYAADLGRIPSIGTEVYHHMLAVNPNLSAFFNGIFIADQGLALMEMLASIIDPADSRSPQDSVDQLIGAGVRHRGYGVTDATLPALRDAFLDVFPHFTSRVMYQSCAADWQEFFDIVIQTLQRGARSDEGNRLGNLYMKQMRQIVAKDWHLIESRQDRDPNHKFITLMCQKAFATKPSLEVFDALLDVRVGKRIFDTITAIVDHLDEIDLVEEYLVSMGVNHETWSISYSDFVFFTNPFLESCEYYLHDVWTVAMETRFARFFQFLIDGMARGMSTKSGSTTGSLPELSHRL